MAETSISTVLDKFADLLRPNRYEVEFFPPAKLKNSYDDISVYNRVIDLLKYLTISTGFPFETLENADIDILNRKFHIAATTDVDALEMTFNLDSEGLILEFFQKWKMLVCDEHNRVGYFNDYIGKIKITLLDRKSKEVFSTTLVGAYPTNRTTIPLSSQSNDAFIDFSISFRFLKAHFSRAGKIIVDKNIENYLSSYPTIKINDYNLGNNVSDFSFYDSFGQNRPDSDFIVYNPFGNTVNDTLSNWSAQVNEALNKFKLDSLAKVKLPSIGIINTNFQSLVNTQYNNIGNTLMTPIQTKVTELQSAVTKKYQELQQQTIRRLTSSIKSSISKIFKF